MLLFWSSFKNKFFGFFAAAQARIMALLNSVAIDVRAAFQLSGKQGAHGDSVGRHDSSSVGHCSVSGDDADR